MKKEVRLLLTLLCLGNTIYFTGCVEDIECTASSNGSYQDITESELVNYVTNYKNNIWTYSCNQLNNSYSTLEESTDEGNTVHEDARCVDYNLDDLQNYLCTVQNSDLDGEVIKLRFYFIQYPSPGDYNKSEFVFNRNYEGRHSIAIVPVVLKDGDEVERYKNADEQNVIANHGHLIPPPAGSENILN